MNRRKQNSYSNRSLLASRNGLYVPTGKTVTFNSCNIPFIRTNNEKLFMSLVVSFDKDMSNSESGVVSLISANLSEYAFGFSFGVGYRMSLRRASGFYDVTVNGNANILEKDKLYRITMLYEKLSDGTDSITGYINEKIVGAYSFNWTSPVWSEGLFASQPLRIGHSENTFGFTISNLIIVKNYLPTRQELEYLNDTNLLPSSFNPYIVAYYPFNQNTGLKAWDVVEQYNYAKVTPLTANHGDLINYTNDEAGVTNPLTQTAWQSLYEKKKSGLNFLKGNGTTQYANIPVFTNQTFASGCCLVLDITIPSSSVLECLFKNYVGAETEANMFYVFYDGINGNLQFYLGTYTRGNAAVTKNKRYRIVINSTTPNVSVVAYIDQEYGQNQVWTRASLSPNFFEQFTFLRDSQTSTRWYSGGINKAILYNKSLNQRERNVVFNCADSVEYKTISGIAFDLDFGDIFLDTGIYYARDNSGNNRHARLYNWTPATDQPLRIEQHTGLPERRKVLKMNNTNQFLSVANFNPTKEKGYTYIFGFKNMTTTPGVLLWKNGSIFKFIGIETPPQIAHKAGGVTSYSNYVSALVWDKLNFITFTEKLNSLNGYLNGVDVDIVNTSPNPIAGFDEIGNAPLYIGGFNGTNGLDGYLSHASIFKGVLTQAQILDIINNGLAGNAAPSLMSDCQLYLNFEEIINDAGTYKIKDWSPQNRTVVMNNYTLAEITPGDPAYKLIDLDTLR